MADSGKLPPEPLTPDEVAALEAATGRSPSGIRNQALIRTLHRTGIRIGEALALMPRDLEETRIHVRHGKGDRSRWVNYPADARAAVDHWLEVRDRLGINGRHPVFCQITKGREGGAINQAYVRAMLPRLGRKAGIEKRVHAHGLRHSYALFLIRERGANLLQVQAMLGHSNPATTAKYLRRIGGDELLTEVQALDP